MIIAGNILMVIGGVFLLLGGFGVLRMPDVFNRIQAGTKATTLGAFSLILGVGFVHPQWLLKLILIIVFIAITNPVGSSVLARAAYKKGAYQYKKEGEERSEVK
ncbi:MAG: monovalent cation/H(+) antiporter subunit G [Clostridia bacterium]|nr:monovalent cation/H(+) antiporter subunit G [Clostridia bacterium]